jgi:hypothetical protein
MPIRSFRTADGVPWQVWNVLPGRRDEERRAGYDRRSPDPVFRYTGPERRSIHDRRHPAAPFLSAHLQSGWLAFESPTEKRRLAPIPRAWETLSDDQLERLCGEARPVLPPAGYPPKPPPASSN